MRTIELLEDWQRKCRIKQRAHNVEAGSLVRRNRLIGIPAVVLSAALGSGLLGATQTLLGGRLRIFAGIAGIAAAILTAIQMSANNYGAAERHRSAGAHFDSLSREIEQSLAICPVSEDIPLQTLETIRKELDSLSERAPALALELLEERRSASVSEASRGRRFEDSPYNTITS
ncbi:SLATT domain-containing protein [Granulicella arctica]|uniref:SLATT domain-containing protein n=1 Tax=Granulicella arctica TaxID=940613 RepID=UPI0021DFE0D5|nr:SLATT domain-containing protein [Granulicella arctica]